VEEFYEEATRGRSASYHLHVKALNLRNRILVSSNRGRDFIHISFDFVHFGMKVSYKVVFCLG
jgi:hypothetical protein